MAALTQTAANVLAGANAVTVPGLWGDTVVAGKAICRDPTTKRFKLGSATHATATLRRCDGIALNGGGDLQPGLIQISGEINLGATLVVGQTYVLDTTNGGICPITDLGAGETVVIIGTAVSAAMLKLAINNSGVAVPA